MRRIVVGALIDPQCYKSNWYSISKRLWLLYRNIVFFVSNFSLHLYAWWTLLTGGEHLINSLKNINLMTASVLSMTVMSGLKSFHKSRLQPKQRLTKKTRRKSGSHNRSRQHVIPLSAGWLVLKQQDLVGEAYCDSWPVSQSAKQSAGPDQVSWSSSHAWGVGSVGKGEGGGTTWFGVLL